MAYSRRVLLLVFGLLLFAGAEAAGQDVPLQDSARASEPAGRLLNVTRLGVEPLRIDGRLDEPVWGEAAPATGFTQFLPNPGAPPSQHTEARVLYDDETLYVGMRMYDTAPDSIAAQLARRDALGIYSDWAHVLIDSYNDNRTGFRFSVNPRAVKKDVLHFNDIREDLSWDAVWEVQTTTDSLGWTAEFRIPLSQLRFSTTEGTQQRWGINFGREIARTDERVYWAAIRPNEGRFVSFSGTLAGLRDLQAPRRLELQPYTVTKYTRAPGEAENPFYQQNAFGASIGGDLTYGLTSDLTLTAAINPDFGQVEADPSVVNLTAFETFFPEKRPFFTEGSEIFEFGAAPGDADRQQLFYSRRIGRAPQRTVHVADGFVDSPDVAPILGAAKISGKTADGWSIGVLNARTTRVAARVVDSLGVQRTESVEPLTNYLVARVSKDFGQGQTALGGIFTATNRQLEDEAVEFFRSAAYVGGVDARHRFGDGNYEVRGRLVGSHIRGSETAIAQIQLSPANSFLRPDAEHLEFDSTRTSLTGWSAGASLHKIGGSNWGWDLSTGARSPGYEVNDLGFMPLADIAYGSGGLRYNQFQPNTMFRRWGVNGSLLSIWTLGGERVQTVADLNGNVQLLNFWNGFAGITHLFPALSTFELRGGPALVTPGRTTFSVGLSSDPRKPLSLELNGSAFFEDETGGQTLNLQPAVNIRPSGRLELSLQPGIARSNNLLQYIQAPQTNGQSHYVFGRLDQTTVSLVTRLSYTFTPGLSLQFYAQPFISGGDFSEFQEVVDSRAARFEDRFRTFTEDELRYNAEQGRYGVDLSGEGAADFFFRDPEFNFKQLRSNTVLRWEYRPGSALFIVWSHGRTDLVPNGTFDLRADTGELFRTPGTNVLLLKLNYWFDL